MKKKICIVLTLVLIMAMLSGCVYETIETTINPDGSGIVKTTFGVSEDLYQYLLNDGGTVTGDISLEDLKRTIIDGEVWYMTDETQSFSSIDEFNRMLNDTQTVETSDTEFAIKLDRASDTDFTLTLNVDVPEQGLSLNVGEDTDPTAMDIDWSEYTEDMVMYMTFKFPTQMYVASNNADDVFSVSGNVVTINLLGMPDDPNIKHIDYVAKSVSSGTTTPKPTTVTGFSDVPFDAWYAPYVTKAAELGLFQGVTAPDENGLSQFAPDKAMTRAEFITVIARVAGVEPFESALPIMTTPQWFDGYIRASETCGLIPENVFDDYTAPITREEMAYIMSSAAVYMKYYLPMTKDRYEIPDWYSIDENYRNAVIRAYSSGLLNGVDNAGTFNPKGVLTRGQASTVLVRWNDFQDKYIPPTTY